MTCLRYANFAHLRIRVIVWPCVTWWSGRSGPRRLPWPTCCGRRRNSCPGSRPHSSTRSGSVTIWRRLVPRGTQLRGPEKRPASMTGQTRRIERQRPAGARIGARPRIMRRPGGRPGRSMIRRPNRLAAKSTISSAVRPRSSRKGLSSNQVQAGHQAAVVQQFHHQVRLSIGGATRDRRADAGGDRGIEEVHVEADMQAPAGLRQPCRGSRATA